MKRFGYISTAVLGSILGITASVSAQQQEDREKPATPPAATRENQVTPPEQVNPAEERKQQEEKPAREEKRTQQNNKNDKSIQQEQKQEQKDNKQTQDEQKRQQKDDQRVQKENRNSPQAKPMQDAHRAGGNPGSRIPDDKFRSHFGREHHFRVSRPVVVSGQPRFQYSGYTFIFVDPWPVGWDYADDCYIDYVDGEYLLFDLAHPGVSIVVNVLL